MATYKVSPAHLTDMQQQLHGFTAQIATAVDELQSRAKQFLGENAGSAIDGYLDAQRLWNQGVAEMHANLGEGQRALGIISQSYIDGSRRSQAKFEQG